MANVIGRQVISNNVNDYIVKMTIIGDGSGDEEGTLINSATGDFGNNTKIVKVLACFSGFSAFLSFDATTDVMACQLPSDAYVELDFLGAGIPNNAGAGRTNDLRITTSGLGNGDSGFLIIKMGQQ